MIRTGTGEACSPGTSPSLICTAIATGSLFVTITVAAQSYHLITPLVGVALAVLVAAGTTAVALRWESVVIGAIGLVGGLVAPVLAGGSIGSKP